MKSKMKKTEAYFKKNYVKSFLLKESDTTISLLLNEIAYGKSSADYKEILYGENKYSETSDGFLRGFYRLRKKVVDDAIELEKTGQFSGSNFDKDAISNTIYSRRKHLIEHKEFLSNYSDDISGYGDSEELIPYSIISEGKFHVHHLKTIKRTINENMSLSDIISAIDPKYQIPMTPKGHIFGKNFGHGKKGNTHTEPLINDPFDERMKASIPNEYYMVKKQMREEYIQLDFINGYITVGIISATLFHAITTNKKSTLLHHKLTHRKVQTGLLRLCSGMSAINLREISRSKLHESQQLQEYLFNKRDSLLANSNLDDNYISLFGDIDFIADILSFGAFGAVIQTGNLLIDLRDNRLNSEVLIRHGFQFGVKTGSIGGVKYGLEALQAGEMIAELDPTDTVIIMVSIYGVALSGYYYIADRKKRYAQDLIDLRNERIRYYIERDLSRLN